MNEQAANPFSPKAVLALVGFGAAVFVLLLWMVGAGMTSGPPNNGGSHAGGRGLNGYAALASFLEKRGYTVRRSQSENALDDRGLLVLTPPQGADGKALEKIVAARRFIGPTLIVTPKWLAFPAPGEAPGARKGWVSLGSIAPPTWPGFLDDVAVEIAPLKGRGEWRSRGPVGTLPQPGRVLSGSGPRVLPLVMARQNGRVLAGFIDDGGYYPALEDMLLSQRSEGGREDQFPVIVVFEPDLIDNYGMADKAHALLADRLFAAAVSGGERTVIFDLTLNGFKRSANLLTLAFTPPFLAATLCLLIAAAAAGWRAFLRFGPPRQGTRAIAFGKTALVANSAGLIRRSRRLHLIAAPYATAARERLAKALALPRQPDAAATEQAIDRALSARDGAAKPFSQIAATLRAARRPEDILKAARALHSLERTLTR